MFNKILIFLVISFQIECSFGYSCETTRGFSCDKIEILSKKYFKIMDGNSTLYLKTFPIKNQDLMIFKISKILDELLKNIEIIKNNYVGREKIIRILEEKNKFDIYILKESNDNGFIKSRINLSNKYYKKLIKLENDSAISEENLRINISEKSKIEIGESYDLLLSLEKESKAKMSKKYGKSIIPDVELSKKMNLIFTGISNKIIENKTDEKLKEIFGSAPFKNIKNIVGSYKKIEKKAYIISNKNIVPYTDSIGNLFIGDINYKDILMNNVEKQVLTHEAMHVFHNFKNEVYYPGSYKNHKIHLESLLSEMQTWMPSMDGVKLGTEKEGYYDPKEFIIEKTDSIISSKNGGVNGKDWEVDVDMMSFNYLTKDEIIRYIKYMKKSPNFKRRYKNKKFDVFLNKFSKDSRFKKKIKQIINQ